MATTEGLRIVENVEATTVETTVENVEATTVENVEATTEGTTLFVGDLDLNMTDDDLKGLFGEKGELSSVKLCTDSTEQFLGYAYVNYINAEDAKSALDELNFTYFNGKQIRISYSYSDSSYRKSAANIFVKNLDKSIDNKEFYGLFKCYGNIVSSKVEMNSATGESKGFGYVQFETEEFAQSAMKELNGKLLHGKEIYVGPFVSKEEREQNGDNTKFTNVFVKNISEHTSEENLKNVFSQYGPLNNVVVMKDEDGNSKGFGFVNFKTAEDAANVVEKLNGRLFDEKKWYVGRAQKKAERQKELNIKKETIKKGDLRQFNNLYVKNLDYLIDDEKLKEMFASFGTITSCKVMRDDVKGTSKGTGFVAFSTVQEASTAMLQMNGKMVGAKPLYVAIAEKKEARKARFEAIFSNKLPHSIMPVLSPQMPMYPAHSPRLPRQTSRGLAPPAFTPCLPQIARHVYPNMFMPMVYPGPRFGRPNVRAQFPFPMMHPSQMRPLMMHQGNAFHLPLGHGLPSNSDRRETGQMFVGALANNSAN